MYFPTWIDLKGADAVPETVHHCVRKIALLSPVFYPKLSQYFTIHS